MGGDWETWRDAFVDQIREPTMMETLKQAALAEDMLTWTSNLTTVIVRSCQTLGWDAAGKGNKAARLPQKGQEYLSIDVMAFPAGPTPLWPFPLAVFELENVYQRVAYSLWKVLCIRTPLRVVIAYRRDWEQSRQLVAKLTKDVIGGIPLDQLVALDGQTVLIVGNRGEGETFPHGYYKFWLLNPNLGKFEKL
jgi:hypothetical protein